MTNHPAVAARSFAAGLFSQKGERIQVNDLQQDDQQDEQGTNNNIKNNSEQNQERKQQHHHHHHHRHGPPSRVPSFGSHSSGVSDSFSSVSSRFNALRRAPSFSFILNFDIHNDTAKVEAVEEALKGTGEKKMNKKYNPNRSIQGRLYELLRNVVHKYKIVFFMILSIIIARAYPPLGGTYLAPHITSSWIAVMIIFSKFWAFTLCAPLFVALCFLGVKEVILTKIFFFF